MALTGTNLISYWSLEEASGTRADATATGNTLTDNNTVTQQTGKIGNAAQFTVANNEWLSIASNASLQTGNIDYAFAFWIFPTNLTFRMILGKDATGANREYGIRLDDASGHLSFAIWNGVSTIRALVTSTAVVSAGAWSHVAAWYDSVAAKAWLQINGGTPLSANASAAPGTSAADFTIGGFAGGVSTSFDGRIDEVGFWKALPGGTDIADLYNAGSGRDYAYVAAMGAVGQPMALRHTLDLTGARRFGRGIV